MVEIDLTKREIEILLCLIEDATKGNFSLDGPGIYTPEEEKIVQKLKTTLKQDENKKSRD